MPKRETPHAQAEQIVPTTTITDSSTKVKDEKIIEKVVEEKKPAIVVEDPSMYSLFRNKKFYA